MTNDEELSYVCMSIRRIRNLKKMSQLELSTKAHLSQSFLANVEAGKKEPSAMTLIRIARALGTSPRDFFPEYENSVSEKTKDQLKSEIISLIKIL